MIVYQYVLLEPVENAEAIRGQLWQAHRYHVRCLTIENERRQALRDLERAYPAIDGLKAALLYARAEHRRTLAALKRARAKARVRKAIDQGLYETVEKAKQKLWDAREALDNGRRVLRTPEYIAAVARIDVRRDEARKVARAESLASWGTQQLVDQAVEASLRIVLAPGKTIPRPLWDGTEPNDPRPPRWLGEGGLGVQIQEQTLDHQDGSSIALRSEPNDNGSIVQMVPSGAKPSDVSAVYDDDGKDTGWRKVRVGANGTKRVGYVRSAEIAHGLLVSELLSCTDTRLRIGGEVQRAGWSSERAQKRAARIAEVKLRTKRDGTSSMRVGVVPVDGRVDERRRSLWLRVGSNPDRSPIWGVWPMVMHRPLPAGARVARAAVHLRRRGPREVWSCELTLDVSASVSKPCGRGVVGLDIGWRVLGELDATRGVDADGRSIGEQVILRRGLRVAAWWDEDGNHGELRFTPHEVERLRRSEVIRSQRDKNLDAIKKQLASWIAEHQAPEWLLEETANVEKWRSPGRLVSLLWGRRHSDPETGGRSRDPGWADRRFDGDAEMFDLIVAWLKHDRHLWEYESEQRAQAIGWRRDKCRCFAKDLVDRYGVLCLEDFDLRRVARRKPVEDPEGENPHARSNRQLVAVSELRLCCEQAMLSRGGEVRSVPSEWTTQTDPVVNVRDEFDTAAELEHVYQPSMELWDQDYAGAKNILRLGCERSSDGENAGTARKVKIKRASGQKRQGRFQRAKARRAERKAEERTAREAADK